MNKAAFLDRDGVINVKAPEGQYVTRWEEVRFLPGVPAAISRLNKSGFRVIVISNQRCVAKGLVTSAEVEALHRKISKELADLGAIIDAVYFCPHDTEPACSCRKPAPGMLLQAAKDHQIDLGISWMIGDSDADVAAGKNAGCKTALIARRTNFSASVPDLHAESLLQATERIFESEGLSQATG
ncbi:MAG: D-glycero-alpha-D-manno-heptose-1,7-bisphosphate 7-phosphatase [Terracidiphilus sp.]|jgi:D-glycero-D-manno-heptose 1,7-bisphosphate phosphatase